MTSLPPMILFINADMNQIEIDHLTSQLYLSEAMTDVEFDARVVADPNYPQIVHLQNLRIMVMRQSFRDQTNRQYADVVIFVKQGLASILANKFGPPGKTYPILNINIYDILRAAGSQYVVIVPQTGRPQNFNCSPELNGGIGGIVGAELRDTSGVYLGNCDCEQNNTDFINRK